MKIKLPQPSLESLLPWIACLTLYVVYAAVDWVDVIRCVGASISGSISEQQNLPLLLATYELRHIAPYIMFLRWFQSWDEND